jgi:hypothetical protein
MDNSDQPHVGLFFYVEDELVMLSSPISEGENDGDFINDPRGHSDCWEALRTEPQNSIVYNNRTKSYDFYPRGRCLYRSNDDRYLLYVDRCILTKPDVIDEIKRVLSLPLGKTDVKLDRQYQCAVCNPNYVPDDVGL